MVNLQAGSKQATVSLAGMELCLSVPPMGKEYFHFASRSPRILYKLSIVGGSIKSSHRYATFLLKGGKIRPIRLYTPTCVYTHKLWKHSKLVTMVKRGWGREKWWVLGRWGTEWNGDFVLSINFLCNFLHHINVLCIQKILN